jgi:CHAT domain-containing protein/tetratricopeptide (TPR) repeat protein
MRIQYKVVTVMATILLLSTPMGWKGFGLIGVFAAIAQPSAGLQQQAEASKLSAEGWELLRQSQYSEALQKLQKALALFRALQDRHGEESTLTGIGIVYSALGENEKALDFYNQALYSNQALGHQAKEANTLGSIGLIYSNLGKKKQALKLYSQALQLRKILGSRYGKAITLTGIGKVYYSFGEKQKALDFFNQALSLSKEGDNRNRIKEATLLNFIASIYFELGEKQKALEFYNQALSFWKEVPFGTGEIARRGEANSLAGIGMVYSDLGEKEKTLSFYNQALTLNKALNDRAGASATLNRIAGFYYYLENHKNALTYLKQSLLLRKDQYTLTTIGVVYTSLGKYQKALEYLNKALPLTKLLVSRESEAHTLFSIGRVYENLEDPRNALDYYNQALPLIKAVSDRKGEAYILTGIGSIYSKLGERQKALAFYNQALTLSRAVEDRRGEGIILSRMASLLTAQKQTALAIVFYKQSVNITESLRTEIRSLPREIQETYTQTIASRYRTLADLLLQQDRILEAQQVLDLLKIQELDDYLRNVRGNAQTAKGINYLKPELEILAKFNEQQKTAIQLGEEFSQLFKIPRDKRTPAQQQRYDTLNQLQNALNEQHNQFINSPTVKAAIKQLSDTTLQQNVNLAILDAQRKNLQQLNAVLIYPLILEDRLELIITTPNTAPLRRTVPIKKAELNKAITEFRLSLQKPDSNSAKSWGQQLYSLLIKPLENDLKQANAQSIIYAPDGALRYIPLAALHDGNRWLIERYRINNITAQSLDKLSSQPAPAQMNILAGAFVQGQREVSVGSERFNFNGLPGAGREVSQLVVSFPGTQSFIDEAFTREAFQPRMNEHNTVHFATHAAFVSGAPENSFIVFGNGDRATLTDIATWSMSNIDMVVLSACETALSGKLGNGEEILGLGYQFQQRGVKATIASLWRVDDGGTEVLMNAFYAKLKQGNTSRAEALRQAQLALINGATSTTNPQVSLKHPSYWSSFILIGNGL